MNHCHYKKLQVWPVITAVPVVYKMFDTNESPRPDHSTTFSLTPPDHSTTIILTPQYVTKKLMSKEFFIRTVKKRSEVWDTFGQVCNTDGAEVGFVACMNCKTSYKYKHGITGTTTMSKHICRVAKNQPRIATTTFKTVSLNGKAPSMKDNKATLTASCVDMVCEDLRPFDTVAGNGFADLLQTVS